MSVRVRFAPSPTGHVHIGNIRVAIFNWLYARHEQGKCLLRIEDTDLERSTPEAVKTLLAATQWLGLDFDEELVYQSKQRPRQEAVVQEMVRAGFASKASDAAPTILHFDSKLFDPSFVTEPRDPAELDVSKADLLVSDRGLVVRTESSEGKVFEQPLGWDALHDLRIATEDGRSFDAGAVQKAPPGSAPTPVKDLLGSRPVTLHFVRRYVYFDDVVLGRREKPLDGLRDLVVARSDNSPIFHLANVVDDVDMAITHVLRGNDHVENTFRHLFIYAAMGAKPPLFGHFPMIVNAAGKPYSKRDGDAYVGDFQVRGILPDCLFNFLALCGWAPGDDREIMSRAELVEAFQIDRVSATPAQFDLEKLAWMNMRYLAAKTPAELLALAVPYLEAAGLDHARYPREWLIRVMELMQPRVRTLSEIAGQAAYLFTDTVKLDPEAVKKVLLKNDADGLQVLPQIKAAFAALPEWTEENLHMALVALGESTGTKLGALAQPLRVAVTGGTASPGIWETVALVGRERTLARIDRVLAEIQPVSST